MFYATIIVCLSALGVCDIDHSSWSMVSDPVFNTITSCQQEALNYLHTINFGSILEAGKDYTISIECKGAV